MTGARRVAFAWQLSLAYTIFVILFGAVVRITGSGAGCGQHWPTCHGEITHLPQSVETLIELTHRVTSGVSMLVVFGVAIATWRVFKKGHGARRAALGSCVFMIVEALVGAALVLLELVGHNDSVPRAIVMAVHLVNTSALLLVMFAAVRLSSHPSKTRLDLFAMPAEAPVSSRLALTGALLIVLVSAAGAVTALGDTLYPVEPGLVSARQALGQGAHFLEQMRGVHPLLASASALYFIAVGARFGSPMGRAVVAITLLQVGAGLLNIYLSAPGWMQVVHLGIANILWLAWLAAWMQEASGLVVPEPVEAVTSA